jgi:hypothetical protein
MNGREISGRQREIKEKRVEMTLQKAAVLRKQDKMAAIAVRKGRLYYPASLVKY